MSAKRLAQHRNALVALARYLSQEQTGGVLTRAIEMLAQVLGCVGAIAYRREKQELALVSEQGLPRKAKPWLARLPIDSDPWFVAQRVAKRRRPEFDEELAGERLGLSLRPTLQKAGWRALAACPIAVGRNLHGVIVLAAAAPATLDKDALLLLETACGMLALALDRQRHTEHERDRRLEESKTAQLATIGLLAATVTQDLAAPLGHMKLQLDDLEEALTVRRGQGQQLAELEELTADIASSLTYAQATIDRLMALSQHSEPEVLDFALVAQDSVALLRRSVQARNIEVDIEGGDEAMLVDGRAESLHLLMVQLLFYAVAEAEAARMRAPQVLIRLSTDKGRHVLAVETSGAGRQSTSAEIFDMFFTGASGGDAVFGLALAKQTVLAHNGHIEVGTSTLGGVLVRVVLPLSQGAQQRSPRFSSRPPPPEFDGEQTVLWIDDDDLFARSLGRVLTSHVVKTAHTLGQARKLLAQGRPTVVFCNVNLPDGSGLELHQELDRQLRDNFVFITGGVLPAGDAVYLVNSGSPTLIKPVAVDEVVALLAAAERRRHPSVAPTLAGDDDDLTPERSAAAERLHEQLVARTKPKKDV